MGQNSDNEDDLRGHYELPKAPKKASFQRNCIQRPVHTPETVPSGENPELTILLVEKRPF